MTDSPELLFAARPYAWDSVCFRFAGVNNPVTNSRYPWARRFGGVYEHYFVGTLAKMNPETVIAAADKSAIEEFHQRTGNVLERLRMHSFPTRVDTAFFRPMDAAEVRHQIGIPPDRKVIVTTGRLCWIKGWDLLLEALVHLRSIWPNVLLIFVGDGEDRSRIKGRAKALGVADHVRITGFLPQLDVVNYMNAADVCAVASYREGWSLTMCEIIACGKPVVSTDVSGARDMVHDGMNGYVVTSRDPEEYARGVLHAMDLPEAAGYSLRIARRYATETLATDLSAIWPVLSS